MLARIGRRHWAADDVSRAAALCAVAVLHVITHSCVWPHTQLMQSRAFEGLHKPGRGLLLAKGLPVKDAARIAHFGLAVRLLERDRTGAMGVPLAANFFCIPFNALHGNRHVMHLQSLKMRCVVCSHTCELAWASCRQQPRYCQQARLFDGMDPSRWAHSSVCDFIEQETGVQFLRAHLSSLLVKRKVALIWSTASSMTLTELATSACPDQARWRRCWRAISVFCPSSVHFSPSTASSACLHSQDTCWRARQDQPHD